MRIAIVGSGVSGLVVAHLLHPHHEITVFEAAAWIGGHAHTVDVEVAGRRVAVDTGFIVYNERNYPHFRRLLAALDVATQPSEMSFGVRCERTGLEYGTRGWSSLAAHRSRLLHPALWRMLRDLFRFHRDARQLLRLPDAKVTLGDWLAARGYAAEFTAQYLLPLGAAIWSADPAELSRFPALQFARFFDNHGLLGWRGQPPWRAIRGGSRHYVETLAAPFRHRIRLRCPVHRVRRLPQAVEVVAARGGAQRFDHVVLATHSDQALRLLADPRPAERAVLAGVRYRDNDVVLHTDASVLPRRRRAWASWNAHLPAAPETGMSVTYHMNRLQSLELPVELCVTLNGAARVDPARVLGRWTYAHPVLDAAALRSQTLHPAISGVGRTHYCGAWWGFGFHEDGVRSALTVARHFGVGW